MESYGYGLGMADKDFYQGGGSVYQHALDSRHILLIVLFRH